MEHQPSVTFLNSTGDVTLTWDETNRSTMLDLIRRKMSQGFVFFTTKKIPLLGLSREVKITVKNIDKVDNLIIHDDDFDKMVSSFDDADIAEVVQSGKAKVAKRGGKTDIETVKRLKTPEEVISNNSLAVRPLAGG